MIILPCILFFWCGTYLTYVFLLLFVFSLILAIIRGSRK